MPEFSSDAESRERRVGTRGRHRGIGIKIFRTRRSWSLAVVAAAGLGALSLLAAEPRPLSLAVGGPTASWGGYLTVDSVSSGTDSCSGTLIENFVLITAAHCGVTSGSVVQIGNIDSSVAPTNSSGNTETATVVQAVNAPDSVDLTLVELSYPQNTGMADYIPPQPVTVNYAQQPDGTAITAVGYGYSDYGTSGGSLQAPGTKEVQATGEIASYGTFESLPGDRYILSGLTICEGDSGGAIFAGGDLVGVITNINGDTGGGKCGSQSTALDLGDYQSWIQTTSQTLENAATSGG